MKIEIKELSFDDVVAFLADGVVQCQFLEVDTEKSKYTEYKTGEKYLGPEEVCFEDVLASVLMDGQPIYLKDLEDDDGAEYVLTLEKMKAGLVLLFEKEQQSFISIIEETYDYSDLDYWLQYSLFDERVWG